MRCWTVYNFIFRIHVVFMYNKVVNYNNKVVNSDLSEQVFMNN